MTKLPTNGGPFGAALLSDGLIEEAQLNQALERQEQTGQFLGETLVELGHVQPRLLGEYLEARMGFPFVELTGHDIDFSVARAVTERIARRKMILPFAIEDNFVCVAMADPLNLATVDDLKASLGKPVKPFLAFSADLIEAINRTYDVRHKAASALRDIPELQSISAELSVDDLVGLAEDAPIVRVVSSIIQGAISSSASDIHIEPQEENVRVRYRLDGLLFDQMTFPLAHLAAVVSRIKIICRMNIAERRRPQDGRFTTRDEYDREYDFRVSAMPAIFGEKIVMRVLEKSNSLASLDNLGLFTDQRIAFEKLVRRQHGIVLVTGPTGSGKSTTLYAALNLINSTTLNINTIEDPVEYHLEGVNQVQVSPKIGVTFSTGLRTLVRQDPDVIMVGEIRDYETAEIAIQAALTGHLVLSTLHTNDAPGALVRLQNMGVEPFLVSSAVLGVVGQRLVRTICPGCRETVPPTRDVKEALDLGDECVSRGKGCSRCGNRGMKGRTGTYEIMAMTDTLRDMVLARKSANDIKTEAVTEGMKTMRDTGRQKVINGITTPEEVIRVLFAED
ncbi:MAG: GspE/PulE family protein [Fimbriimonadales bacterium]